MHFPLYQSPCGFTAQSLICSDRNIYQLPRLTFCELRGLVSIETVVLRRWGSDTRKFGLSTELIM